METLNKDEYGAFYQPYISEAQSKNLGITDLMEYAKNQLLKTLEGLSEAQISYRYAEGKWSVKEILQHLIDAERIFAYRALRFARFDKTDLPGYDENYLVAHSFCDERDFKDMLEEFSIARKSSVILFKSFNETVLQNKATCNGYQMSVRAIGYAISGHQLHHLKVIKERYLEFPITNYEL